MVSQDRRGIVHVEHRSALGAWHTVERRADPRLRRYLHGFVASASFVPAAIREWHVPSLEVAVVLNFESPHRYLDDASPSKPPTLAGGSFVVGLQRHRHLTEALGARRFIVMRFTPIGAHLLLKTPMSGLADAVTDLTDIDAELARSLIRSVEGTPDVETQFDALETSIAGRLESARQPRFRAAPVWDRIVSATDRVDLATLADESGCSPRHLIAQFRAQIGMPPKTVARLVRFDRALQLVERIGRDASDASRGKPYLDDDPADTKTKRNVPWSRIAVDCGYYDQAHFINDFRAFAGATPLEFVRDFRTE